MGKYKSYRTWQGTDINGPYVFILLDSGNTGVQTLQMDFKSEYRAAYNEILKTLNIKQIPVLDILRQALRNSNYPEDKKKVILKNKDFLFKFLGKQNKERMVNYPKILDYFLGDDEVFPA